MSKIHGHPLVHDTRYEVRSASGQLIGEIGQYNNETMSWSAALEQVIGRYFRGPIYGAHFSYIARKLHEDGYTVTMMEHRD